MYSAQPDMEITVKVYSQEQFEEAMALLIDVGGTIKLGPGAFTAPHRLPANIRFEGENTQAPVSDTKEEENK